MIGDRAQLFTLEGVLAGLVVLAGVAFALQATVLTPATSGATEAPVDASEVNSVLTKSAESGALKTAVVDSWGGTSSGFSGAPDDWYTDDYPNNDFGEALSRSLGPTTAVNVIVYHRDPSEGRQQTRLIYDGVPGSGAVRSSTVVTVYNRDIANSDQFYAADIDTNSELYNVLEVEVVAWQT